MFTTIEINRISRLRARILTVTGAIGISLVLAYFAWLAWVRDLIINWSERNFGQLAADFTPPLLILPAFAIMLAACWWIDKRLATIGPFCPACKSDISKSTRRVLASRCCTSCGEQIVEGKRTYGKKVLDRYYRRKQLRFLKYWLWGWPIGGLVLLALHGLAGSLLAECPQALFVPGLIGTSSCAWALIRTRQLKLLPLFSLSLLVLLLSVV
ncbi:hypothetical protein SH449x_002221 [Pirellulaceae bacterium SH449]